MNLLAPWMTACALAVVTAAAAPLPARSLPGQMLQSEVSGRDWIAKSADNICGLRSPDQLSNPAVVDFDALLEATPEMKKMRDEKIRRDTPEGIRLTTEATNRVAKACENVQSANGYCSVWKKIRHKDGRSIPDVTAKVKALL